MLIKTRGFTFDTEEVGCFIRVGGRWAIFQRKYRDWQRLRYFYPRYEGDLTNRLLVWGLWEIEWDKEDPKRLAADGL